MCATFGDDGNVTLEKEFAPNICATTSQGHFGLVVQSPIMLPERKKIKKWKVVFGSAFGGAIGAFLLGLLLIAMFVNVKKKARLEEMERRAYEEEALQVSMAGHVIRVHNVQNQHPSLKRYGASIQEFHLGVGVDVHPYVERVLIVTENLGSNWSNIYYDTYDQLL
nr:dihydrolipoyllysine-residue succinyltransferase component of 2-oxoglutarate dehydrogenase [Tanacetum cinerariifolium]